MKENVETAFARQQIYSFLAGIFLQEPEASVWPSQYRALQALAKTGDKSKASDRSMTGDRSMFDDKSKTEERSKVSGAFYELPHDSGAVVKSLCQEFYNCFFVPMSGRYVPPYESALLAYDPEKKKGFGHLNSSEAAHVAACYEAVGFNPRELNSFLPLKDIHLPDHVGFELAFMAVLCGAEKKAWDKATVEEAQRWQELEWQFLREHPSQWLPNFCQALGTIAPGYYAQAACAANEWVAVDVNELGKRIGNEQKTLN